MSALASNKIALVFCLHANPWLIESTVISLLLQKNISKMNIKFFAIMNGPVNARYDDFPERTFNAQISSFDSRVKECLGNPLFQDKLEIYEFENCDGLDSGAWWKLLLMDSNPLENFDYVWFLGEGGVLTTPFSLDAMVAHSKNFPDVFIGPGHEVRRLNFYRATDEYEFQDNKNTVEQAAFQNKAIKSVYEIFNRLPSFARNYLLWKNSGIENKEIRMIELEGFNKFYKLPEPWWFGCSTNNWFSGNLLMEIRKDAQNYKLNDSLQIPFCGTPLELIWGILASCYTDNKFFGTCSDRLRKNKPHYPPRLRVDVPMVYAKYLNSNFPDSFFWVSRGRLVLCWLANRKEIHWRTSNIFLRTICKFQIFRTLLGICPTCREEFAILLGKIRTTCARSRLIRSVYKAVKRIFR